MPNEASAPQPRSILIVSQVGPPGGYSAARRIGALTKYLGRAGHRVTVLTSLAFGSGAVEGARRTVRTRDLVGSSLNPRRARFEAIRDGTAGPPTSTQGGDYEGSHSPLAYAVVPDLSLVGWIPFALPRALALARRERFDCVITTSPPESGHLIGMALRHRGVAWIADLRDGWTFETTHPAWPLAAQRRLDEAMERAVAQRADLVTCVTDPITEDLRGRVGAGAVTLPNGFDPEETAAAQPPDGVLSPGRHSLVHTGRMAFSGRSPEPLLEAVRQLDERSPEVAAQIEVAFAGPLSAEERTAVERPLRNASVRALGTLDHPSTVGLQRSADSLLLITGGGRRSEATAKLYEYLAAQRPILVLGERSAAAEIVRDAGAGLVTAHDDPGAIAAALRELVERPPQGGDALRKAVERFTYPRLAGELADHVEAVVASPATSR